MADTPFEFSTTLNATAQLLDKLADPYDKRTAVAPSNQLENIRGYDVELPFMKGLFLQFKRPHLLGYKSRPFSFHTDHNDGEQLETLQDWAEAFPRSTFYAFPLVPVDSCLDETLRRTLFIDPTCLRDGTSRIRVNTAPKGSDTSTIPLVKRVRGKVKGGEWYDLDYPSRCCIPWHRLHDGLRSRASGAEPWIEDEYTEDEPLPAGLVLYRGGEPALAPDADQASDRPSVFDAMERTVEQQDITFWEQGLTAGLFER